MLLAGSIFLLTLILVIWQPRGLSIGWSASIGAVLALVTGVIHINDIPVVWNIVWTRQRHLLRSLSSVCYSMRPVSLSGPHCTSPAGVTGVVACCFPG